MNFRPVGSRVKVKLISNETLSQGGIIVPGIELVAAMEKKDEGGSPNEKKYLQLVEVLDVGDGRLDPSTGGYRGSRFKKGQRCLMRVGLSAQVHIDHIPGRVNEALVLEDVLVAVEEEARAPTPMKLAAAS